MKRDDPTGEELSWMQTVFRGDFHIIPRPVVVSVIAKGLGIPNLGGTFNLTSAGRALFVLNDGMAADQGHIVKSQSKHRTDWRMG